MDSHEQIQRAKDFLDEVYEKKINDILSKGQSTLVIDFAELIKHDPEMSDEVLESPEETIRGFELAMEGYETKNFKVRFTNLPQAQYIAIRNIRSPHLDKLMYIEGIVRQSSDVRPQVTTARFECPSCGNTLSILQLDTKFKEPTRCSCGRKGKFFLFNKREESANLRAGQKLRKLYKRLPKPKTHTVGTCKGPAPEWGRLDAEAASAQKRRDAPGYRAATARQAPRSGGR